MESKDSSKNASQEEPKTNVKVDHHSVFNPSKDLPENFFMILYGMRRCGKSTTLKHMLYTMRKRLSKYRVYLFSGTAKVDPMQYTYFPKVHQFHDIEQIDDDIGGILDEQTEILNVPKAKREEVLEKNKFLIVLDDVVNEQTIRHSKSLNYMAVSGRHIGGSVIILSQLVAGSGSVPPIIRTQSDVVMLCTLPRSQRERDLVSENYLTSEDNSGAKEKGKQLMEHITSMQYRNMVISMFDTSARKTREFVSTYGPVPEKGVPDDFRLGLASSWDEESDDGGGNSDGSSVEDSDEEDENGGSNVKHASAIHGGDGLKHKGIVKADKDTYSLMRKQLERSHEEEDDSHVPPAFSGGRKQRQFRSFVQYSMRGASAQADIDERTIYDQDEMPVTYAGHKRLQGQRFEKPEMPKKPKKKYKKHTKDAVGTYGSILSRSNIKSFSNTPSIRQV